MDDNNKYLGTYLSVGNIAIFLEHFIFVIIQYYFLRLVVRYLFLF